MPDFRIQDAVGSGSHPGRKNHKRGALHRSEERFKSSEFYATLALVVAILVATYVNSDDSLGHQDGWLYASVVAAAYILSRGLAKLGAREPDRDD